ncbi:MAG: NfeD family protein [Gammaproteobacteria bacterium]|nr:NfeD family protein [Gammaproteobacteria bacterium]
MPWWGWIIIGVLLLGAELLAVDAQFYLIFIGAAALIVGLGDIAGPELPAWVEWLAFAALSVLLMFTLRRHLYEKLRSRPALDVENDVGRLVSLAEDLAPGRSCRAEYRGSHWTAINIGNRVIPRGGSARIESVDGLTLQVTGVMVEE